MAWSSKGAAHRDTAHHKWRAKVLRRDAYQCQACGYQGSHRDGYIEADHIHNLAEGGSATDPDNGQALCKPCHSKKTAGESQRGRLRNSNERGRRPHPALG